MGLIREVRLAADVSRYRGRVYSFRAAIFSPLRMHVHTEMRQYQVGASAYLHLCIIIGCSVTRDVTVLKLAGITAMVPQQDCPGTVLYIYLPRCQQLRVCDRAGQRAAGPA